VRFARVRLESPTWLAGGGDLGYGSGIRWDETGLGGGQSYRSGVVGYAGVRGEGALSCGVLLPPWEKAERSYGL
jgi:hypothetical protein